MILENSQNYLHTLRNLGDRSMLLPPQDYRDDRYPQHHHHHHPNHQTTMELNLSLNSFPGIHRDRNLERLFHHTAERSALVQNPDTAHNHMNLERLCFERTLTQSFDRNVNISSNSGSGGGAGGSSNNNHHNHHQPPSGTTNNNNNNNNNSGDRDPQQHAIVGGCVGGGGGGGGGTELRLFDRNLNTLGYDRGENNSSNSISGLKYGGGRENQRESSRSLEGGAGGGGGGGGGGGVVRGDEGTERGATPSTPPTPLSVGENFNEEKVFGSKAELQLHTQAHMREAKPYKCSQCCKAFANSSYLSQHTRIHLGIKPYRCDICQRKFTQLSHLQQHIRTHTGDKPYKCRHPGCQKAFSQLSNLQSHSRCHQTDKPYKCNSCYKCFSDEPSLLEHIPKHKESKHLKTHICQYCGKSYTQETYLQKHMQKHAERTDKRPPIGPGLGLNNRSLEYWPKVSPDSAENMHDYPNEIPRGLLEQNDELVIIRQQMGNQNASAPPGTPGAGNLGNSYDTNPISKSNTNSAFTPINSMSSHLNPLNHPQLGPNRQYLYDTLPFQKQNSLDMPKGQPSNGFPNQLISLHHIRNYAHQTTSGLMEHSILGGLKDK